MFRSIKDGDIWNKQKRSLGTFKEVLKAVEYVQSLLQVSTFPCIAPMTDDMPAQNFNQLP